MRRTNIPRRYGGFVFSVGGARVVGILITSLTFPYVVRRLGVEMYGLWNYVLAICTFLGIVANPGLTAYASQQLAARREAAFELVSDVLALRVLSSLVAGILLFVVAFLEVRADVRHLLQWFGAGILITNAMSMDFVLTALEMFHASSLLTIMQQTLYAIGVFVLVRSPKDIFWLPASILISAVIMNVAAWGILWRRGFQIRWILQSKRWKDILVPSAHYAIASFMSSLYTRTGHIVVRWSLGEHALGLYSAAIRFVDILRHFIVIVLNVLTPRIALAVRSETELTRLVRFASVIIAVVSIPLTMGLMSTAHLVVPWLMGTQYMEAVPLLRWMALYLITASAASLFAGTILYAMGRHRAYLVSTCGAAISGVIFYLVLTPTMGLTGAGLAFVLAQFVVAAIAYVLIPPELRSLWKSPVIGVALFAGLLMAVAVRVVNSYNSRPLIVISSGALVYLTIGGWFSRKWLAEELLMHSKTG